MADEQIQAALKHARLLLDGTCMACTSKDTCFRCLLCRALIDSESDNAALRAQVAAMAEWAAKAPCSDDCESRICKHCECLSVIDGGCVNSLCSAMGKQSGGPCNCKPLPADLIARGRELLDAVEELKLWRQHLNPGEELNAALKHLKGESK